MTRKKAATITVKLEDIPENFFATANAYAGMIAAITDDISAWSEHTGYDFDQIARERINNHYCIVWHDAALQLLECSPNNGAAFETGDFTATDFQDAVSKMAYAALLADVCQLHAKRLKVKP